MAGDGKKNRRAAKVQNRPEQRREYLKQILKLQQITTPVSTTAVAEAMDVAPPSATDMLKKLAALRFINYRPYHGITLTKQGEKEAIKAIRRHRIVERFLTDMMGFEWHEAHAEALAFEQNISDEVERRMFVVLDKPQVCPHGYPIPSSVEDTIIAATPLYSLEPGQAAKIVSVEDGEPELLRFMDSMGMKPGVAIKVDSKDPFKGPMQVEIGSKKRTIGWHLANQIFVDMVD